MRSASLAKRLVHHSQDSFSATLHREVRENTLARRQRRIRPELDVGIAGARDPARLKCLHAHAAFALARPGYALGEAILSEADELWCPDARCTQALVDAA